MATIPKPRTRRLTIIAQDPSVKISKPGKKTKHILRATVEIPAEITGPGPRGYRVQVIDYDPSSNTLFRPLELGEYNDPYAKAPDSKLISDPEFHAINVYAIIMRTLARFEFALGRRVSWSFEGHQIQVAPHAFADANAFYSKQDWALMFGYFPGLDGKMVFSCLSHDVVAHETTHALVDGLRERFTDPSSPDQAGFHEGFADVVALLSIFSLPDIVAAGLDLNTAGSKEIHKKLLTADFLRRNVLLGVAEQMGQELAAVRGSALRQSATLVPSRDYVNDPEFEEPHRRGELLVAAVMNAFLSVWIARLEGLGEVSPGMLNRQRVVEEGATAADHLLTMSIRALDYTPTVDLQFCDFLSALLTADRELTPDDTKYNYRQKLVASFASYGMDPASKGEKDEPGVWEPPKADLNYDRVHFEPMQRDPDEVFRFIWENRKSLCLDEDAFTKVMSVRPCLRIGSDGFALRETVAEYVQMMNIKASELKMLRIKTPKGMSLDTDITLYGGGALIFDEYGKLKFHVHNSILNRERQSRRLEFLYRYGFFNPGSSSLRKFSSLHRQRIITTPEEHNEEF
jgi:hypothetical protein